MRDLSICGFGDLKAGERWWGSGTNPQQMLNDDCRMVVSGGWGLEEVRELLVKVY